MEYVGKHVFRLFVDALSSRSKVKGRKSKVKGRGFVERLRRLYVYTLRQGGFATMAVGDGYGVEVLKQ